MRLLRAGLLFPIAAFAHTGETLQPHDLPGAWVFEPGAVIPLLACAALYGIGARRSRGVTTLQRTCFWTGWAVLALALISPLHRLGSVLFCAHMAQHEILMLIAAPLLVLSRPLAPFLWGVPFRWRRRTGRWVKTSAIRKSWAFLTTPLVAWILHAAVLWTWHAPALFRATLSSDLVHTAQHASFLFSALLFWWALFFGREAANHAMGVFYVFTTAVHTSVLGALLTFSPVLWYPEYGATAPAWGLSGLQDQQTGGLIMWVPAGVLYTVVGLALFAACLRNNDIVPGEQYAE